MSDPKRRTNLRNSGGGRAVHDIGGQGIAGVSDGPIDRHEHDPTLHEKRVDALVALLRDNKRRVFSVDALRRVIEDYAEQEYDNTGYYEKWMRAVRNLVVEQELLTRREIDAKMAQVRQELEAQGRRVSKKKVP